MSKTILWIYNMPLKPEAGGTERITSLVAKGLTGRGHRCMDILVFDKASATMTYKGEKVTDLYAFLKENHVDIIINQIAYAEWLLRDFLARGGQKWRAEGGKIISCLHFDPKPTSDLYFLKSIKGKTIRDYFNIAKAWALFRYYKNRQEKRTEKVYNWIYDNSDCYVTLSPTHFPYFKQVTHRSEYEKLYAINNPLTFDDIADESILNEKHKVVLVCSRMDEYQKRISLVLKVWRKIQSRPEAKDWILKIIGNGPDLGRYREYVMHHHIENVSIEGQQSPEYYYREADIFLMTSTGIEGWGLTLTESLQRGVVPVVMNTCSVFSDIITSGYNGYLTDDNDLKMFANLICSLMADEINLRKMQLNALQSAHRFTLNKTMDKWENLLSAL